jgi:hypothetical protein
MRELRYDHAAPASHPRTNNSASIKLREWRDSHELCMSAMQSFNAFSRGFESFAVESEFFWESGGERIKGAHLHLLFSLVF